MSVWTCRHAPLVLPAAIEVELIARYREPHRAYHDAAHIAELLGWFDVVAEAPGAGWRAPAEVFAAIYFHDAVYAPGARDNEARSAALAHAHAAALGVEAARVAALIELTARHGALTAADVTDADTAHFLDADMAIVGTEPAAFDRYDAAIRREYAQLPDDAYRAGRHRFLAGVLARPRIFFSALFHDRLDARARENLARAIARLGA
jgi:predicted metal-dependent HD superfamily phosphohydrolase